MLDVLYSYDVCGRYVQSEQMRCKGYAVLNRLHKQDMQELYIGDEEGKTSLVLDEIVARTVLMKEGTKHVTQKAATNGNLLDAKTDIQHTSPSFLGPCTLALLQSQS